MKNITFLSRLAMFLVGWACVGNIVAPSPAAAQDWPYVQVAGPFVCRADFVLGKDFSLLVDLAQLQQDLITDLRIQSAQERIELYLFHDRSTYTEYLKKYYPNVPFRRALYVKAEGQGRVFAFYSKQFEVDMRHECTHALLHASLRQVPLWIDEGLASYYELPKDKRLYGNPYLDNITWDLRFNLVPSLDRIERLTDANSLTKIDYRDSWAWVYFCLNSSPMIYEMFAQYISDLNGPNAPYSFNDWVRQQLFNPRNTFKDFFERTAKKAEKEKKKNA